MAANEYKKPDYWSKKAFAEGYAARSVYKLKELNEKFHLLEKSNRVLDLGAAPGSWTTFVLRFLDGAGHITSVDLQPLSANIYGDNLVFIQGNMYDDAIRVRVAEFGPYDALLCDAAPPTTGNRVVDTARSSDLVDMAIWYAGSVLKEGGNFAAKVFQGGDQSAFLKTLRTMFSSAKAYKPEACRNGSFETYLVGIQKKPQGASENG